MACTDERGLIPPDACDLRRPVLRDPVLQEEFDRRGYVVVPMIGPNDVQMLHDAYVDAAETEGGINPPGAYNDTYAEFSVIHSRTDFRRTAFELITSTLRPAADRLLVDYRPLYANFVNKLPGSGVVPAHQNFSVVDEARFQSVSVWVALVDCEVRNGAMLMGDGTHRVLRGRRGMWAYQTFSNIEEPLISEFLNPLPVKAGDAVILDDAIVHYSPPNLSENRRLAVQFVMVPNEADALWFQQVGQHDDVLEVDVWRITEPFFFEFWHGDGDSRYGEVISRIEVPMLEMDIASLRSLLRSEGDPPQIP